MKIRDKVQMLPRFRQGHCALTVQKIKSTGKPRTVRASRAFNQEGTRKIPESIKELQQGLACGKPFAADH